MTCLKKKILKSLIIATLVENATFTMSLVSLCQPPSARRYMCRKELEMPGIDPGTSHMLSARSTIWATPPCQSRNILLGGYEQ